MVQPSSQHWNSHLGEHAYLPRIGYNSNSCPYTTRPTSGPLIRMWSWSLTKTLLSKVRYRPTGGIAQVWPLCFPKTAKKSSLIPLNKIGFSIQWLDSGGYCVYNGPRACLHGFFAIDGRRRGSGAREDMNGIGDHNDGVHHALEGVYEDRVSVQKGML